MNAVVVDDYSTTVLYSTLQNYKNGEIINHTSYLFIGYHDTTYCCSVLVDYTVATVHTRTYKLEDESNHCTL